MASFRLPGLVLMIITLVNAQNDKCDKTKLDECRDAVLAAHFDFRQLDVPPDSIAATCNPIKENDKCVEDFFQNCERKDTKIEDYITEGYKILLKTCDMFEKEYLPKYPCYAKLSKSYEDSMMKVQKIVTTIIELQSTGDKEGEIKNQCCEMKSATNGITEPTMKECGRDASDVIEKFLVNILPPFLPSLCEPYKDQCSATTHKADGGDGNDGTKILVSMFTFLASAALTMLLNQW